MTTIRASADEISRDPIGDISCLGVMTAGAGLWKASDRDYKMAEGEFQLAMARVNLSLYIVVANDPMDLIDALGLKPFELFPSFPEAAKDGACYSKSNPTIIDGMKAESAAGIFKINDQYYYNNPRHGDAPGHGSSDADLSDAKDPHVSLAGTIHDHVKGEDFSKPGDLGIPKGKSDIEQLEELGVPGILVTPTGKIKQYDPKTDKTTIIGTCE